MHFREQFYGALYYTELQLTELTLSAGEGYHVRVTACNNAGLCSTVTSDGVIPDDSPPVIGRVVDGLWETDLQFQADMYDLSLD